MIKALSVWLLVGTLAVALGAPVDVPLFFSRSVRSPGDDNHSPAVMSTVCANMSPVHGDNVPMPTPPPFAIHISQSVAAPGDTVQVRFYGLETDQFIGLYAQGRHEETPVGQLIAPSPASPLIKVSDCPPGAQNAASYISRQPISELTFDYVVPDVPSVVFKATFMKSFALYWTFVSSDVLVVSKSEATTSSVV